MCRELLHVFNSKSSLTQYLFIFTLDFLDNSALLVKGGKKLSKRPEMESSGKRYGVGEIKRTRKKISVISISKIIELFIKYHN